MNKRIVKKAEKRRRDKIHELLDMTLDINSTMPRKQGINRQHFLDLMDMSGPLGWKSAKRAGKQELLILQIGRGPIHIEIMSWIKLFVGQNR